MLCVSNFDEVKLKEDLVYDKHSGEMIGLINVGDVNNCLAAFQRESVSDSQKPQLATHMLVFMVCGMSPISSLPMLNSLVHRLQLTNCIA